MNDLFLSNKTEITFLEKLKDCLSKCNEFYISVSFIKKAGLVLFQHVMEDALKRGCKGVLITSGYQCFTDIPSLDVFLEWTKIYPNFKCHFELNCFGNDGFHSKGYLFKYDNSYEFIVGSTNITRFALLKNVEWNVSLSSNDTFDSYTSALDEFNYLFERTFQLDEKVIENYKNYLKTSIVKWDMDLINFDLSLFRPNSMQVKALKELKRYRDMGVKKAMIIAATGSGKTYLAAFDAKNFDAKRLLFVVHRDAILSAAKTSFMKVFGAERSYSLYTSKESDLSCDFIFASSAMLSNHLDEFLPNEFDYIIFDECHHQVTSSYKSIIEYFTPEFVLGLTATPERTDKNDIYSYFEENVPFELRLRDAIINDLVVPFHYYAIKDEFVDYSSVDKSKIAREISRTINVDFICDEIESKKEIENIKDKLKAIAFCTSISHAKLMASELTNRGYFSIALTGESSIGERIKAFNDLQDDTNDLQIICAVDILNEGIDIPRLNMVLFLRPTESQTVFIQQLGRGLRKYPNKKYVTVLDFIGNNYERSVQIALALGTLAKTTYTEKAFLKDLVRSDFQSVGIEGLKINFDELSKTDIIAYIDKQNFYSNKYLFKDYQNFKGYLNSKSFPKHTDYLNSEIAPDLMRFMKSKSSSKVNKSYYKFLREVKEDTLPIFTEDQIEFIDNVSLLLPLFRLDEYLIINQMLNNTGKITDLIGYNSRVTEKTLNNALKILEIKKIIKNSKLNVSVIDNDFLEFVNDLLNYGLIRCDREFGEFNGKFKLYANYYKEQIQMAMNKTALMNIKGTEFDIATKETYLYVGLNKDSIKDERHKYKDIFISDDVFEWESEINTDLENSTGKKILATKVGHLFIRKMKSENGITLPFTYFGTGKFENIRPSKKIQNGKEYKTLTCDFVLDNPVPKEFHLDFNIPEKIEIPKDNIES